MSYLGVSAKDRFLSRISFYILLVGVLWTTNLLLPVQGEWEKAQETELGIAEPLIGVPVSEVPEFVANLPGSR